MNYKQSSRNPQYGKIFAYDKNGNEIQELDILKLVVVYNGREYKIGELLEFAANNEKALTELSTFKVYVSANIETKLAKQREELDTMKQLLILMDAKIKSLELK